MKLFSVTFLWCLHWIHLSDAYSNILVFPVFLPPRDSFYDFLQTHLSYADHNVSFLIYKSDTKDLKIHPPPQTVLIDDISQSDSKQSPRDYLESWEQNALNLVGSWEEEKHSPLPEEFLRRLASRCQSLLKDKSLIAVLSQMKLDMILVDLFGNDLCGLALGRKLKLTVAGYLTGPLTEPFAYKVSAPFNPSYLSVTGGSYNLDNLFDRMRNAFAFMRTLSFWDETYFGIAAEAACSGGKQCSNAGDFYRQLSVLFINSDLTLESTHRPLPPNIIFLGGLHCQISALLPKDLDTFARSYRSGLIYVSLVTALDGADLPKRLVNVIIEGLGHLPYATFWKTSYLQPNHTSHPKNVLMEDTFLTQDVLGHGRTRLAITFCDTSSVISCIYHGVPIICIPLNAEQLHTARTVVTAKAIGVVITLDKLTSATLAKTVQEVVANKSYRVNSRREGELLRDKPETPSDRLVFWVEHAIRRKGISYLRGPNTRLGLFRYLFLDALLLIVFTFSVSVFATLCVVKVVRHRQRVNKEKIEKSE